MEIISEKELVLKFKEYCDKGNDIEVVHVEMNSKSAHMDCELQYDNQYIRLEAKYLGDSRNNSQKALKSFGGILKGRNLPVASNTNCPICYGILLSKEQEEIALDVYRSLSINDWNLFGLSFNVKYIFIFNCIGKNLEIRKWENFIIQNIT